MKKHKTLKDNAQQNNLQSSTNSVGKQERGLVECWEPFNEYLFKSCKCKFKPIKFNCDQSQLLNVLLMVLGETKDNEYSTKSGRQQ